MTIILTPEEAADLGQALVTTLEHAMRSASFADDFSPAMQYEFFRLLKATNKTTYQETNISANQLTNK